MIYIIIGVFLVLIVMNLFLFIVIRQMSRATGRQIEKDAMRLCAVYDRLLEEKSEALRGMEQEPIQMQEEAWPGLDRLPSAGSAAFYSWEGGSGVSASFPSTGHYRDSRFTEAYHRIGETFRCTEETILRCAGRLKRESSEESKVLDSLLKLFTFGQICRIVALEADVQREFIGSALSPEGQKVYEHYMEETGRFELSGFLDYVRNEQSFRDQTIVVCTGDKSLYEDLLKQKISGMEVKYDRNMCEGFKLIQGSRMYDYSI